MELFNLQYKSPEELPNTVPARLRYYRTQRSLLQSQVAEYAGIDRTNYNAYEHGINYYPLDVMKKIAEYLKVDLFTLIDDYHAFTYEGQGQVVRDIRGGLNLSRRDFASLFHVHPSTVKDWENEYTRVMPDTWRRLVEMEQGIEV